LAELRTLIRDNQTQDDALDFVRSLVDEVAVVPDSDRIRIDLKGELASILAFAAKGKKAGRFRRAFTTSNAGCGDTQPALLAASSGTNSAP
jgi:hypothetical protein